MQTFELNGMMHMVVHPVGWMEDSAIIRDHLARGDTFCVRMRTGELTVITKKVMDSIQAPVIKPSVVVTQQCANNTEFYRDKLRKLAADARAALGE